MEEQQWMPSRGAICAVAALLGSLIVAEPFVMNVKPGFQIFQGVILIWFWVLFMFGGTSDRPAGRK